MAKFKRKQSKLNKAVAKDTGLFDSLYSKQNQGISINAGLMSVFYEQTTSIKQLNQLKRKYKRRF